MTSKPLKDLQDTLAGALPHAVTLLRNQDRGEGFLHVYQGGALVVVEYRAGHGFGVTCVRDEDVGLENPDETHSDLEQAAHAVERLLTEHGRPSFDARLLDGLRAAADAIGEVVGTLAGQRGTEEKCERLSVICTSLKRAPDGARSNFTGDPKGVVANLEKAEEQLRVEARRSAMPEREKLEAVAETLRHLANMTASADKARWAFIQRHRFPA